MYTFNSRIRYSEADEYGKLTLTGIMNYLQDCTIFQSEDIGRGIAYLTERHRAWWMSSWQIVIDCYPVLGEEVVIGTWAYDFKGCYGYRNFTICDKNGKYMVRANSIWFLFDTELGRPVRVTEEDGQGYCAGNERCLEMEYAPRKIKIPAGFKAAECISVAKHHIDTNHHVNNARYVEIAREVLPSEIQVGELRVEYKKAAVCGDTVYPHVSRTDEEYTVLLCDEQGAAYAVVWFKGKTREEVR